MDIIFSALGGIASNLFTQVPLLIGSVALLGLLLQKKPFEKVVSGTIRSIVGVVILTTGIDIFVHGLVGFQVIVSSAFGFDPPESNSDLNIFLQGPGAIVPLVIAFGFFIHMILVKLFPAAKYVYLTGHLMMWMSIVLTATLTEIFGEMDTWILVLACSVIIACYWTLQPLWIAPLMRKVVGHDNFGLGHTTSTLALLTGYGASALKLGTKEKHDAENLKIPRQLAFFKDINVSTALIITVIMLIAIGFSDKAVLNQQMAGSDLSPWSWGMIESLKFAAGIAIILFGVRTFLAEIVPAFKGISDKLLPGAKPALDVPVIYPASPISVMLGFVSSLAIFLILMMIFAFSGWFVLVPPMIMLFFGGGTGGVFGNAIAGWRGAVFGGVLNGIILAFGQWISWGLYSNTAPEIATLSDPDWYAVGWALLALGGILSALGSVGIWIMIGIVAIITVFCLTLLSRKHPYVQVFEESKTSVLSQRSDL